MVKWLKGSSCRKVNGTSINLPVTPIYGSFNVRFLGFFFFNLLDESQLDQVK